MLLYLVRHGQSADTEQRKISSFDINLSQKGIDDAGKLAERLSGEKIEKLISSDQKRALQTADIIAKKLNLPIEKEPLIRERKKPTSLIGRPIGSDAVKAFDTMLDQHADEPEWRYEDAENTADLIKRINGFLQSLESVTNERVCAVTHAGFLRHLAATLVLGDKIQPSLVRTIFRKIGHDNTAISVCEFIKEKGWKLITWNDQAHLGEPTPVNL